MVEPLFIYQASNSLVVGQIFCLDGDEGRHAAQVRRLRVGQLFQVTDGHGFRVHCEVVSANKNSIDAHVLSTESEPQGAVSFTLVQALAKSDRDEMAVQACTELGVQTIVPWASNRSISKWDGDKQIKGQARWQQIALEASKQALLVWHPNVEPITKTVDLETKLGSEIQVLVLDPTSSKSITSVEITATKVAIVVGPEGGIDADELSEFEKFGFNRVHLGTGILRTSTAAMAAISFLSGRSGLWG